MYVRIVHHWCKPGQIEAGRRFIDRQGVAQTGAPGFRYRYRMEPPDGPTVMTTLSAWEDEGAFERFRAGRKPHDFADSAYPFERVEHQAFTVLAAIGAVPGG